MADPRIASKVRGGLIACAAATVLIAAPARATDFPTGSLALGHPHLRSEDAATDGLIGSRVPAPSQADADELLVTIGPNARARLLARIRSRADIRAVGGLPKLPVEAVRVPRHDRGTVIRWLRRQPGVTSVQPDVIETASGIQCLPAPGCMLPDDPGVAYQWDIYNAPGVTQPVGAASPTYGADVDAPHAWSQARARQSVRIAVIDTGIDAGHPDLAGRVVAAANFTASNTTQDLAGHGTHVAGIAAASFDNGIGIAGMAPDARLMDVKVLALDASGRTTGDCADVADGIVWATDHGAEVLNLSLGSPSACQALEMAVDYATSRGALVIAAAGNEATTARFYPAALPDVLSVAATTNRDQIAAFSNRGADWVDVAAPGDGIVSTLPTFDNGTGAVGYGYLSGTSMAAPVVSGIAALVWGELPAGARGREVDARIVASAQPIEGTGTLWRYGRVDACLAMSAASPLCAAPPSVPAPAPPPPASPPPSTAVPAPIPAPRQVKKLRHAAPGTYVGSLTRRRGAVRLVVGDGGDALIGVRTAVPVRCASGRRLRVAIAALSTVLYGRIRRDGRFGLRVRRVTSTLRRPQLRFDGRFDAAARRARGTLRLTGTASNAPHCDSRSVSWTARLSS